MTTINPLFSIIASTGHNPSKRNIPPSTGHTPSRALPSQTRAGGRIGFSAHDGRSTVIPTVTTGRPPNCRAIDLIRQRSEPERAFPPRTGEQRRNSWPE